MIGNAAVRLHDDRNTALVVDARLQALKVCHDHETDTGHRPVRLADIEFTFLRS